MLSVTYAQTALKIEQDNVRSELSSFKSYLRAKCKGSQECERHVFQQLLDKVKRIHLICRWRRLEVHVLPEIRSSAASMDRLVEELETMRLLGFDLYRLVRDRLRNGLSSGHFDMQDLYWELELYLHTVENMVEKEERELFTVLFESMPVEKWFSIAEKFMLQDSDEVELGQVYPQRVCPTDEHQPPSLELWQRVESSVSGPVQPDIQAEQSSDECIERNPFRHPSKGRGCFAIQAARCGNC